MDKSRKYTIQIELQSTTAGGEEVIGLLDDLKKKAGGAAIPLDELKQAMEGIGKADTSAAADDLKNVADALNDVAQANVSSTTGQVGDLSEAIGDLSAGGARGTVAGLSAAIKGLADGDIMQSLGSLSNVLYSISNALPTPGVAIGIAAAIAAISTAYKYLSEDAAESKRALNEFGETLDEEMARMESYANSTFEWYNLLEANKQVRADFGLVKGAAEAALTAIDKLYAARSKTEESSLRSQADAAERAGNESLAAQFRSAADQLEKKRDLVQQNLRVLALQQQIEQTEKRLATESDNYNKKLAEAEKLIARQNELFAEIERRTGNIDATVPGSKSTENLVSAMETRLSRASQTSEKDVAYLERTGSPDAAAMRGLYEEIPKLTEFIQELKNLKAIVDDATAAADEAKKAQDESNTEAVQAAQELIKAKAQLKEWTEQLNESNRAVSSAISDSALAQAKQQIGSVTDMLTTMEGLSIGNVDEITQAVADTVQSIDLATTSVPAAIERLKEIYAEMWAADQGSDLSNLLEDARRIREVIDVLGTAADQQTIGTPDEVVASIQNYWEQIKESAKVGATDTAESLDAAGKTIIESMGKLGAGAVEGGNHLVETATRMDATARQGMEKLNQGASNMAAAINHFASVTEAILRSLSTLNARVAAADVAAARALSQIENMR